MCFSIKKYWQVNAVKNSTGVSSACFYPLETEKSLELAGEYGFHTVELFLNSHSELEDSFVNELISIKDKYNLDIASVHPFASFAESFYLFSNYERRYTDILPLYDRLFEVTAKLGADIFVFHGAKIPGTISDEEYCRRFSHLIEMGKKYGVRVCQENVVHHRSESPAYLKMMKDTIGDDFKVVLDIKQAHRAGYSPYEFIDALGKSIIHVHISDRNSEKDCIPPLTGEFDFPKLFNEMKKIGYKGKYIIELYYWSYEDKKEIVESYQKLIKMP